MQLKSKGLECHIVPTINYDHQWSGSIRSYKKIKYFDVEETPAEISLRNDREFKEKWNAYQDQKPSDFLESGWKSFAIDAIEKSALNQYFSQADALLGRLQKDFPNCKYVIATQGMVAFYKGNFYQAADYYREALKLDPQFGIAVDNLEAIKKKLNPP